jgi:ribosome maturation factor RimP
MGSTDAIRDLLEPALASAGVELWDVEVSQQTVRVSIDRPGGIDLDAVASVANRVVSPLLDDHPELTPETRFTLEVSSPGLERPLRTVDQYRRYIGTQVSIKTTVAVAGSRRHRGALVSVDDLHVTIRSGPGEVGPTDAAGTLTRLRLDQIDRARTVLDWGTPRDTPGRGGAGHKPSSSRKKVEAGASAIGADPRSTNDSKDS